MSVDWDLLTEGTKCTMQLKCNNQWSDMIEFTELGRRVDSITFEIPAELSSNIEFALMIQPSGVDGVFGKINLYSAKLEIGGHATPFCLPDPATELMKCQRYYQIRTTNDIDPLDLRPSMGTITDIRAVEGGYAYVTELR